jgi:hypothetical protein
MQDLLQSLGTELEAQRADARARAKRLSRSYKCRCGAQLFFRNTKCLNCDAQLGYLPDDGRLVALDPPGRAPAPGWRRGAATS